MIKKKKDLMKNGSKKYYPIGQVVSRLKGDYPTLSISKLRYLEDEGLMEPKRTKGGYRQFSDDDVLKLVEILKLQKDYFLPLQVIKEKMSGWDAKKAATKFRLEVEAESKAERGKKEKTYSAEEILKETRITSEQLKGLENYGLVDPREAEGRNIYSRDDVSVVKVFFELSKFGIEPRHLRIYENLASKEVVLFEQIIAPKMRSKGKESKKKVTGDIKGLSELAERLQRLLRGKALENSKLN